MNEIGGYFSIELPLRRSRFPHDNGYLLNSGRNALELILRTLQTRIKKIWIPVYTCDSILVPLKRLNISYDFYNININLEIEPRIEPGPGEIIIVNNYFGIKDDYITHVWQQLGDKIIIDNTQAWYAPELPDANMFFSPRKFFGIPDGGIAFSSVPFKGSIPLDYSYSRCSHLLKRLDSGAESGYEDFRHNSILIGKEPLKKMSNLTKSLLASIDFPEIREKRKSNFKVLDNAFKALNLLTIPSSESFSCPMIYPLMLENSDNIRKILIANKVYVPTYWKNVTEWCKPDSVAHTLVSKILPLPIDQRYSEKEMKKIITIVEQNL